MLTLELQSPSLPPGQRLAIDLSDPSGLNRWKENPVHINEGAEYKYAPRSLCSAGVSTMYLTASHSVRITFDVQGTIVSVLGTLSITPALSNLLIVQPIGSAVPAGGKT